jgi:hypothetical protein
MIKDKATPNSWCWKLFIPTNQFKIKSGYYDNARLCRLLRRIACRPSAVLFVADMLE